MTSHGLNVSTERLDSRDVVLNVSSRSRLGLVTPMSRSCLSLETLTSRSPHHTSRLQPWSCKLAWVGLLGCMRPLPLFVSDSPWAAGITWPDTHAGRPRCTASYIAYIVKTVGRITYIVLVQTWNHAQSINCVACYWINWQYRCWFDRPRQTDEQIKIGCYYAIRLLRAVCVCVCVCVLRPYLNQ